MPINPSTPSFSTTEVSLFGGILSSVDISTPAADPVPFSFSLQVQMLEGTDVEALAEQVEALLTYLAANPEYDVSNVELTIKQQGVQSITPTP